VVYKATEIEIAAGDTVTFLTAGGGGYGDPRERSREMVARDVAEGLVSPEAAAKSYEFVPAQQEGSVAATGSA
jgi:N-methylhydantoinase B